MTVKSNLSEVSFDFAEKFIDASEKTVRATAVAAWNQIVEMTPVDTGRAQGNWFATKSGSTQMASSSRKKSTAKNAATRSVLTQHSWSQFTLTNNLAYISELEYGRSDQAPNGMVRVTFLRIEQNFNTQKRKHFK